MIVIDKFDNIPSELYNKKLDKVVRIGSSKKINNKKIELISIDISNNRVIIDNGETIIENCDNFSKNIQKVKDTIFLIKSREEYSYFLKFISYYNLENVISFQDLYILRTKYYEDPIINLKDFKKIFNIVDNIIDIKKYLGLYQYIWSKYHYKIERKLRSKNILDSKFIFGIKQTYSEVFKFMENRDNRLIYVLDVNSMYPYCLTMDNFTEPKSIKYSKDISLDDIINKKVTNGLFSVKMKRKQDYNRFIDKYHYLTYSVGNNHFKFNIEEDEYYLLKLHCNEILYYSKYFDIEVIDGLYSENSISFPLKNDILELYNKKNESYGIEKDLYKSILVLLSSITFKNYFQQTNHKNWINVLKNEFYIRNFDILNEGKYFKNNRYLNIWKFENIISIFSQMYANSNIYMMNILEKLYNSDIELEICYINIDSIHISIAKKDRKKFEHFLYRENLLGKELGKLKIEAIGNYGLWLDIGKYWILDKNRNIVKDVAYKKDNRYIKIFKHHVIEVNQHLFNNLTFNKKLNRKNSKEIYFDRFNIYELIKSSPINLVNQELRKSLNRKKSFFYKFFKE